MRNLSSHSTMLIRLPEKSIEERERETETETEIETETKVLE